MRELLCCLTALVAIGEANAAGNGTLTGSGVSVRGVRFRTQEIGTVTLTEVETKGPMDTEPDDRTITIREKP